VICLRGSDWGLRTAEGNEADGLAVANSAPMVSGRPCSVGFPPMVVRSLVSVLMVPVGDHYGLSQWREFLRNSPIPPSLRP
jgi:hypothetical protein